VHELILSQHEGIICRKWIREKLIFYAEYNYIQESCFICVLNLTETIDYGYVPLCRSHFQVLSSIMTYYRLCSLSKTTGALVEQELLILPEHLSSFRVFSGVRVTRYLTLCVWFVDRCLSFCPFSFGYCVFYPSSIYGFWLPLWYLQTLLTPNTIKYRNPVLFVSLISQKQSTTEMSHLRKALPGPFLIHDLLPVCN
jgi:hypothetical protein